jgi:hypothetical protein
MRINIFFISLLIIIIIPGAYYVHIQSISYSRGALISVTFIYLFYLSKYKSIKLDKSYFFIFSVLILTFISSLYAMASFDWFEYRRFFFSYFLIGFCMIGSIFFVILSYETKNKILYNYISAIFYIILLDGIIFAVKKNAIQIWMDWPYTNPFLFFFPEISHFSLIFLPLLLFKVLTYKNSLYVYVILLMSLNLAIATPNMIIMVGTFFVFLMYVFLMYSIKKTIFFLIPAILIALYYIQTSGTESLEYFIERLSFVDTKNVSVLVLLSGWERAYLNLFDSNFLGIGFNQLGYEGEGGYYQDKLNSHNLVGLNLKDGGSLAPKLISELGILGVFMLSMYLFYFIKIVYKLKKYFLTYSDLDMFYISIFIMSFVYLFLRGSGYFSPSIFLLSSSIIYFIKQRTPKL